MRRRLGHLLFLGVLCLATGCRTVVTVDIVTATDGSGTVTVRATLDAEAAAALGGADRLALDDLAASGWTVGKPSTGKDGALTVHASRPYRDGDDLAAVLEEIGGKDGVFSATSATVSHQFGRTTYRTGTTVSVTGDPAQFSDAALTRTLGGLALGRSPEELAAAGVTRAGAGELVVKVRVPDHASDEATFDLTGGTRRTATVDAESTVVDPLPLALAGVAVIAVVVGLVLLVVGLRRRRRARRRVDVTGAE